MKSTGILFSGEMVRAILDGRKSQTRRMVKPQPVYQGVESFGHSWSWQKGKDGFSGVSTDQLSGKTGLLYPDRSAYGVPGDEIWVKETFRLTTKDDCSCYDPCSCKTGLPIYRASQTHDEGSWKPSIFMPRKLSRITLKITGVRVERVQEIGKDGRKAKDVLAEGITPAQIEHWAKWLHPDDAPAHTYGVLWDSINGKGSWAANPWVWVVEFEVKK